MSARILLAEDDAIQRMDLSLLLTEQGYQIVGEAADGQRAIELAESLSLQQGRSDLLAPLWASELRTASLRP